MRCPECGANTCYCIDSRPTDGGRRRRRYECQKCKCRFNTKELYDFDVEDTGRVTRLARALRRVKEEAEAAMELKKGACDDDVWGTKKS